MRRKTRGYMALDVYSLIKRKIITLELKPGESLRERELEKELGIGRTPIREAILMLKAENLLDSRPNEAPYVKDITLKGVKDFFVPFMAVEKLVMRLAAQKVTPEILNRIKAVNKELEKAIKTKDHWNIMAKNHLLHSTIAQATDNEYIIQIYETILNQQERLSYMAISEEIQNGTPLEDHWKILDGHHKEIISLLEKNDVEQAEILGEAHVRLFQQRISMYLANS